MDEDLTTENISFSIWQDFFAEKIIQTTMSIIPNE